MTDTNRKNIVDAIYILNDLFDGLVAGTQVIQDYQSRFERGQVTKESIVAVQKMCVSQLILVLSKLNEFWESFNDVIPPELRPEIGELVSKIGRLNVKEYRNTVVAHIRDTRNSRVQTQFEAMKILNRISANSPRAFLEWLNNPMDNQYPKTVLSIVAKLRDSLREAYKVGPEEVFNR